MSSGGKNATHKVLDGDECQRRERKKGNDHFIISKKMTTKMMYDALYNMIIML